MSLGVMAELLELLTGYREFCRQMLFNESDSAPSDQMSVINRIQKNNRFCTDRAVMTPTKHQSRFGSLMPSCGELTKIWQMQYLYYYCLMFRDDSSKSILALFPSLVLPAIFHVVYCSFPGLTIEPTLFR